MAGTPAGGPAAARGRFQRLNSRIAAVYGSIVVPPAALLLAAVGVGIVVAPHRYTTGSYQLAFDLAPARLIGAVFVAAGAAALLRPRWPAALGALVAVHVAWALVVVAAAATRPDVSPTAPAYPLFAAWVLFSAVAGMGYR